jgi:hypothetical protein
MVKYFAMIAFVLGPLVAADSASAFGRHCRSCGSGGCGAGGCPGGVCYAPVAPSKTAATTNAPPGAVAEAPASAPAPAVTAAQPQTTQAYASNTGRRGLFGRR